MMRRVLSMALLLVLLGGMFASVQAGDRAISSSTVAQDDDRVEVRVGTVPVMVFAPVFLADLWGYFEDEGLNVEIMPNVGGAEPLAPLARSELDVVIGGIGAGQLNYAARNIDVDDDPGFRIVMAGHNEAPPVASPLVVSAERYDSGELTSVEDLAGGRVSINATGSATEYWMYKALEQGGLTFDDVELVSVAFPDVPAALNSGAQDRVDAAILGEPIASAAEQAGLVKRLSTDFIEDFQPTFVYMANDFIADNPEAAEGFVRAMVRAYRDLQDPSVWRDPEVVAYLGEVTFGYREDLLDYYAFPVYVPDGTIDVDDLNTLQDYFMEREVLAYDEPLDVTILIDNSVLDAVIDDMGVYEADMESDSE